jgi:hypothetical protein
MVSGITLDLNEWLTRRTWVDWEIGVDGAHRCVFQVGDHVPQRRGIWDGYTHPQLPDLVNDSGKQILDAYGRLTHTLRNPTPLRTHPPIKKALHSSAYFTLSSTSSISRFSFSGLHSSLQRYSILDRYSDLCGTIVLDKSYLTSCPMMFQFIAISGAKEFNVDEIEHWAYYITGERDERRWYAYYALMVVNVATRGVEWEGDENGRQNEGIVERRGLAKIYKAAFEKGSLEPGMEWREFTLV